MKFFQRRTDEQVREAYRVRIERGPLRVFLVRGEAAAHVELVDLSAGGCAIACGAELMHGAEVDQEVLLRIESAEQRVFATARIRSLASGEVVVRVGLQFVDRERVWAQLDERLWRYFNRREGLRVGPGRDTTGLPSVTLRGAGTVHTALIHDLSTTGLSVRVSVKDEVRFEFGALYTAEFELPDAGPAFRLGAVAVHEVLVRGSRRVGFRFDALATPDLEAESERILQFVLARQRRTLQERSDGD